jgi:hypothetical protein
MNNLSNGSSNNIELWLNLNEKISKSSVNSEEVREILRRNVKFKGSGEFFSVVAVNMKDLGGIVFDNSRYFSNGEMCISNNFLFDLPPPQLLPFDVHVSDLSPFILPQF